MKFSFFPYKRRGPALCTTRHLPNPYLFVVLNFFNTGALLIQEAGGLVTDLDGTPYKLETRNMLCSNGFVHDEVLGILRDADAVSFKRSTQ